MRATAGSSPPKRGARRRKRNPGEASPSIPDFAAAQSGLLALASSALAALFGLPVQPIRQASRALLRLGLAFRRSRSRRRRGGVPGQTQRFEPLGLLAQRGGCGFVLRRRLFGVVGALYFGELRIRLMIVGFIGHLAILFHEPSKSPLS